MAIVIFASSKTKSNAKARSRLSALLILLCFFATALSLPGCVRRTGAGDAATVSVSDPVLPPEEKEGQPLRQPLVFLFVSDTQANPDTGEYSGVAELLCRAVNREEKPALVLFGGDTVNNGGDAPEWLDFWGEVGTALDGLTTAAVAGNHDNNILLTEQFDYPRKASESTGTGFFYSLFMEPVFFLMLDSNKMGAADRSDVEWLQKELRSETAQGAAWRVAVMHHPMWPPVDIPKDLQRAEIMREHFLPLLEANGIDLILCGHQHVYSRTEPMDGGGKTGDKHGIVQIVVASGGKDSYTAADRDFTAAANAATTFLVLTVDDAGLTVSAYDDDDELIDCYILDAKNR